MHAIRKRLSVWSAAWLLSQFAALAAFVPPACCASHRQAAKTKAPCHEEVAAHCARHEGTGPTCPLHGSRVPDPDTCSMRSPCDVPAAVLASLLSIPGILAAEGPTSIEPDASFGVRVDQRSILTPVPPDTPPPRC